ncbi:MAG: hypothetical protein BGO49_31275 [Planctomycetales bacterium 71-10]|mgnify:CR=1 FL=1|nr:MAG: hypothetical protein BGO49_31275 [Planctomycetales bacterium 71-10]
MEPVVTSCGGCGKAIRIRRPEVERRRECPACGTELIVPRPGPAASRRPRRRRAMVGAAGLMELTLLMMAAAPLAVWCAVAWSTAASASPPWAGEIRLEPTALRPELAVGPAAGANEALSSLVEAAGRLGPAWRFARSVAAIPDGLAMAGGATARLAWGPARRAFRLLPFVQDGFATAARGDEIAGSPANVSPPASVLTPPDFGSPSAEDVAASSPVESERRFLLRDESGRQVVARLHGCHEGKAVLVLPDGRLGIPSMLVPADEPFRPLSADEVAEDLLRGPFEGFKLHRTEHYLILHQGEDDSFARSNGLLLEDLYARLLAAFRKHEVTVHEAEFPLVAVIFKSEEDFRRYRPVAPDVQAYYEIYTNRIFLYEEPSGRRAGPEVDALLKPQMTAHEGTHQILQNIGVQPRLAEWPLWLIEGLAEYCATPASRKGQPAWDGLGQINNLHMATLRELEDPVSLSMRGQDLQTKSLFRKPGQPLVEAMIRRGELTPTEYALAWAMTHYLAMKRSDDFTRFLRVMAAAPPLEPRSADDHVRAFRQAFGDDLGKLDRTIHAYLNRLTKQKGYDPMPYYAVLFEQPLANGLLRRAAMVSQSPQLIKQWIGEMSNPAAGLPSWQAAPFPSRARADLAVREWMQSN